MPKVNTALLAFNRGVVAARALGRIDVDQLRLAARIQTNWLPLALGPMMLRPGTKYLGSTLSNAEARIRPFIFGTGDVAFFEFTDQAMRVWVDDAPITRPSVSTTITSGTFSSATGWTLAGTNTAITGGALELRGTGKGDETGSTASQLVTCGTPDVEHAVRVVVLRGPVTFMVGTGAGTDEYVARTQLETGTHSLAFTPAGNFYVYFIGTGEAKRTVDSVTIEAAGTMSVPTPWATSDLTYIRIAQSGDVVYAVCDGIQPRKIQRRATRSWSVVLYEPLNGPFGSGPAVPSTTLTSGNLNADTGLSASSAYFQPEHVGALFRLVTPRQDYTHKLSAADTYAGPVEVNGNGSDRGVVWATSGTWVGTVTLLRSYTSPNEGFTDVSGATTTGNGSTTETDSLDGLTIWYKFGFKPSAYTSGTLTATFTYGGGEGTSVIKVTEYVTTTSASIELIVWPSSSLATGDWAIGDWNAIDGYPSAVTFHDGRLFFGGRDKVWGTVPDDFENFDPDTVGATGPINRSFGYGPFATINWMMSLQRLMVGRDMSIVSIRSSAFDSPLTPTDFTMRDCSGHGAAPLAPVSLDSTGVFIDKSGRRVYELVFDINRGDYTTHDLTRLNPDIGDDGFTDMAVQRQPDTRVHLMRGDGTVGVLLHDAEEQLEAWWIIQIAGTVIDEVDVDAVVESVCVLPGNLEDVVYYVVKRTINGSTKRYIERFARQDECIGGNINKNVDSHVAYENISGTTTLTGLSHLEGQTVCVWGNGKDLGTKIVSSGQITGLSENVENACVGLAYTAQFESAKLAYGAALGTPLNQKKKIEQIGLVLLDTHYQGVKYGPDFDTLDDLPLVEGGTTTDADTIWSEYDAPTIPFPGEWHTDSRLCLQAQSPRPATVMALSLGIITHDKA